MSSLRRREMLALGAAGGLMSCAQSRGEYFGSTAIPGSRRLVHTLPGEPETLDPALSTGSHEFWVLPALLEGLTQYHPRLPQPMAALATHYEASPDQTRFTFYLRGNAKPRGVALPNAESLPSEFTRSRKPAPDSTPALWSDGLPVTAHDFVYSWRRFLHPKTAAPLAYQLYYLANAEEVNTGRRDPEQLGVRALDDFTLQVELRSPTPFFLDLITQYIFHPVPRHAVEGARQAGNESWWTEPGHMVGRGPFLLRQRRRYERISTVRNPLYYDSGMVGIDELDFVPVVDGTTVVNLYKSGEVAAMPGAGLPYLFIPVIGHKRDFHREPAFGSICLVMSVRKPPMDNVLLRYALNMATEKEPICDFVGGGRVPARTLIPPVPGYRAPSSLPIRIDGREYDVLQFEIEAARSLVAKAGARSSEIMYHFPLLPETRQVAEMMRQQWLQRLGIRLKLVPREFNAHWSMVLAGDYTGVAEFAFVPLYFDPNPFLDPFVTPEGGNPSGWTDPEFNTLLADANQTPNRDHRMAKLAFCEERLLRAMPLIPFYREVWAYLRKPFVRGLASNVFDTRAFKYAWIDTNWRPA
jgi:oligopeptide transport system substrate-binding protein